MKFKLNVFKGVLKRLLNIRFGEGSIKQTEKILNWLLHFINEHSNVIEASLKGQNEEFLCIANLLYGVLYSIVSKLATCGSSGSNHNTHHACVK